MNAMALPEMSAAAALSEASEAGQELLTFRLGGEHYGIDILKVQEIRGREPVTRIANAPAHVRGVINLRGIIVPVMDLRVRFGLPTAEGEGTSVHIIVNVGTRVIGIVVDGVSDVVTLPASQVRPGPEMAAIDASCITGLGMQGDRMLILLDVDALVAGIEAA
ncbi:MAG: chemotaxis protein CheW [Burkholderiales bacterium]|nr:chemotaxis protein CheW [Burkholderiales bacterium]